VNKPYCDIKYLDLHSSFDLYIYIYILLLLMIIYLFININSY